MIIGIAGLAGSGKDTAAAMLQELYDTHSLYSFANPLKACMNDWLGWGYEHGWGALKEVDLPINADFKALPIYIWKHFSDVYDTLTPGNCIDAAEILQHYMMQPERVYTRPSEIEGQVSFITVASPREVYQWFGTESMRGGIHDNFWIDIAPTGDIIIPDVRFPNEAEFIHEQGGRLLRIVRKNVAKVAVHSSEDHYDTFKYHATVTNDGDFENLRNNIDQATEEW